MQKEKIAYRYAFALVQSLKDEEALLKAQAQLLQMAEWLKTPHSHFSQLMCNPAFNSYERESVLREIDKRVSFLPLVYQFIKLLIWEKRMNYFIPIVHSFAQEIDKITGQVAVQITSARPLFNEEVKNIQNALHSRLQKNVYVSSLQIDESYLGGFKAQIGGLIFDATLQTQLKALQKQLASPTQ